MRFFTLIDSTLTTSFFFSKVRDLACIAKTMMGPLSAVKDQARNCTDEYLDDDSAEDNDHSLFADNDCVPNSRSNSIGSEECSENDADETSDRKLESSNCLTDNDTLEELEPSLYAEKNHLIKKEIDVKNAVQSYNDDIGTINENFIKSSRDKIDVNNVAEDNNDNENEFQPVLYEHCCDFVNTETNLSECVEIPLLETEYENAGINVAEFEEVNRSVEKSLRVYTHKKRKLNEEVEKNLLKITDNLPELPNSDCIDLIGEPSRNDTELESEYILTLSPKNVETVIDFCNDEVFEERKLSGSNIPSIANKQARQMKEIFTNEQSDSVIYRSNSTQCPPTLRRSVRLSQHESEDPISENPDQELDKRKDLKKGSLIINKRKNRDADYTESDENKNSRKSVRANNTGKLSGPRGGIKARLSLSRGIRRKEENVIANGKLNKSDKMQVMRPEWCESFSKKFNTIATVSRALWGDMSDCLENSENNFDALDHSPSKEIPFAVGLLPLRAALERMQAMPDYQPRKTRSSAMPFKQEFNGARRKNQSTNNNSDSSNANSKRQSVHSNGDNINGNTVCHVRITASSHSQPVVRSRRKLIDEEISATISTTNIVNRR